VSERTLERIEVEGYKSIANTDITLRPLNVLVGPNGAGKSNLISVFGLLGSIVNGELQLAVARAGGASTLLYGGQKQTEQLRLRCYFGVNQYEAELVPAAADDLVFQREICYFHDASRYERPFYEIIGSGMRESNLANWRDSAHGAMIRYCRDAMTGWRVFHFHDTSAQAGAKQKQPLNDNIELRPDAANLAPFLLRLRETDPSSYDRVVDAIRAVAPFFRDFRLIPDRVNEERVQLEWLHRDSDAYFNAHSLSDGTLRFMCLMTLLLQPNPPSVIVIDEPELGLHPFAITQLAETLHAISETRQLIVSTQSVTLLNQLDPADILITEQLDSGSRFTRPDLKELESWLREYAVGELWEKNILGGRPYSSAS
jgi:predicted ATPase